MKLILVLSFALGAMALGKSYEGYQVFRVTPHSRAQFDQIQALNKDFNFELDYWRVSPMANEPSDIMVPPQHIVKFKNLLNSLNIEYSLHFDDVQSRIDEETRAIQSRPVARSLASFNYNVYHSYQEISDWVTNFRKENSGGSLIVEEFELPSKSFQGRAIKGLKLTTGSGRLGAYTQGGIHAREWVSPATVINLVKKFVDADKAGDSVVRQFFNKFDWYIIPVLNVDGYHFTRPESANSDRMWRKNKQDTGALPWCEGIDMNRNYGYKWGSASNDKCQETYQGAYAYEAVELKAVTDWLISKKQNGQNFMIHVDIHSYSQYWVYPFSYTYSFNAEVPDNKDLHRVAKASTEALRKVHGTSYQYMTSGDWYPASGASEDFGYMILGAKYTYTIEMRDTGKYGFLLPENQIQATGEETYAGIKEFFRQVLMEV